MKILANDGISEAGAQKLTAAGFELITEKVPQDKLQEALKNDNIDVLLVRSATKVTKEIIDGHPGLKLIGRGGVGLDNIDVSHAEEKGIKVINTPDASSRSVAELAMAHLMSACRFLHQSNRNMPLEGDTKFSDLKKNYGKGQELKGKTIGIIGTGRIGKQMAELSINMGMKPLIHNRKGEAIDLTVDFFDGQQLTFNLPSISKEELLKQSDFVSLHTPAQSGYLIGKEELNMMPKGSAIINISRGGLVDEEALLASIEKGHTAFAALDVFEAEPTPSLKLLMNSRISLSPHIGGATQEAQENISISLADQIIEHLKTEGAN